MSKRDVSPCRLGHEATMIGVVFLHRARTDFRVPRAQPGRWPTLEGPPNGPPAKDAAHWIGKSATFKRYKRGSLSPLGPGWATARRTVAIITIAASRRAQASCWHFFMKLFFAAPASGLLSLPTAFGSRARRRRRPKARMNPTPIACYCVSGPAADRRCNTFTHEAPGGIIAVIRGALSNLRTCRRPAARMANPCATGRNPSPCPAAGCAGSQAIQPASPASAI
jgi:hypothetical protein